MEGYANMIADAAAGGLPKASGNDGEEWAEQCRRNLRRDTFHHIKYGFAKTYKPVMDDASCRVFDTMAEYREWCETQIPDYLGYKRA